MSERALVVTVSTRAAAGAYADRSGPIVVEELRSLGLEVAEPVVVAAGAAGGAARGAAGGGAGAGVVPTGGAGGRPPGARSPGARWRCCS